MAKEPAEDKIKVEAKPLPKKEDPAPKAKEEAPITLQVEPPVGDVGNDPPPKESEPVIS